FEALAWTRSPVAQGSAVTPALSAIDWIRWAFETASELADPPPLVEPDPPHAVITAATAAIPASRRIMSYLPSLDFRASASPARLAGGGAAPATSMVNPSGSLSGWPVTTTP